jgi:predicted O-methyltransferase YrrM
MKNFEPQSFDTPRVVDVVSAWGAIPSILKDLIEQFKIKTSSALEFGVERGYSLSALANYFTKVTGVDKFFDKEGFRLEDVRKLMKEFKNIRLVKSSFEDFILKDKKTYDLIHIDIFHSYESTFQCGDWSCAHADCVIFHDTISYPNIMRAVTDLATKNNFTFYNYPHDKGLGILIKNKLDRFDFSPLANVLLVCDPKDIRVK